MEQIVSLILGVIASFVQGDFLKGLNVSEKWRIVIRYSISLLASIAAGFAVYFYGLYQNGENLNDITTILANIGTAFAGSQTYYNTYFRLKNK